MTKLYCDKCGEEISIPKPGLITIDDPESVPVRFDVCRKCMMETICFITGWEEIVEIRTKTEE